MPRPVAFGICESIVRERSLRWLERLPNGRLISYRDRDRYRF